ncbi:MAG TPA: PEGA domain-containing protein, partial [Polyangiaceae bacterium]|nr:PEGA domain-containing protein [Polyangiaceae bacterium]
PQPPAPGTLRIESDMPELQATVDGNPRGPLSADPIALPPGEHVLRFSAGPRYEPLERRVELTPGQVIDVGMIRLRVLHGLATIRAGANAEGAEIAVDQDGSLHSLSALPAQLEVDVEHPQTLVAERPGYLEFKQPLVFPDGQAERTFEVQLTAQSLAERADAAPEPASPASEAHSTTRAARRGREANHVGSEVRPIESSLTLTAQVPSSVLLDGVPLGMTPLQNIVVPPGTHEVTFVHDRERNTESFELKPGEHKRVSADLETVQRNTLGDTLDPQVVERTVRSHNASLRDGCWQRALRGRRATDPTSARISAQISVDPSGRVQSVVASGAPAAFPDLGRCIEEDIRYWRFPSARAGTTVNASFAFVLE